MARFTLDFHQKLKDLDDKPMRAGVDASTVEAINLVAASFTAADKKALGEKLDEVFGKEMTLASAAISSLLGVFEDEKNLGEQERLRRYELARRINKVKEGSLVEFNNEERDLIKTLSRKRFLGSLVSPTISDLLEGAEKVKDAAPAT